MKKIKCYIVNASNMSCELRQINDDLQTFYNIIDTDCIEIVARKINGKMTQIICDEEGKLKKNQLISGMSEEHDEVLLGNLIIKSDDKEIENIIKKYGVLVYSTRR